MHNTALLIEPAEDIADPLMLELFEAWQGWAQDEVVPRRARFDPLDFPRHLAHLTIFDVLEGDMRRFRVRLCGTEVAESMGVDTTGMNLDKMPNTAAIEERFNTLCESKQPYFIAGQPVTWISKRQYVRYDCLALPFSQDGETVSQILFVMKFD